MRKSKIKRKTKETDISVYLNVDGNGLVTTNTGIGFFDHMIESMGKHGFMDIEVECNGDLNVDQHHTVEDIAIVLGKAFKEAIGDKAGIRRYSSVFSPMDEALAMVALDISGRPYLNFDVLFTNSSYNNFDFSLIEEFFRGFVNNSGITLHIKLEYGKNNHHISESIFKGFGRTLAEATTKYKNMTDVVSTKGVL